MDRHTSPPPETLAPVRVVWPPPGLERSQGTFSRATRRLAMGGSLLALPVILSAGFPEAFNSLGVAGSAWWALNLLSLFGLVTVVRGLATLFAFFSTAHQAALRGIDLETILQVAADKHGDMAALMQGTRCFRTVEEHDRTRAVRARVWSSLLYLSAATWISVGWVLSILLSSRGIIGPPGLWLLTMGPAAGLFLSGMAARGVEEISLRAAFGLITRSRWRNLGQNEAAEIWGDEVRRFRAERGESTTSGVRAFLTAAATVVVLGTGIAIPGAGFLVGSSMGPALASMAVPRFSATLRRAAEAEALTYLRLEADQSVSPLEAGEAIHVLSTMTSGQNPVRGLKQPARSYETAFFPDGTENPLGIIPPKWPKELFPRVLEGLTPEEEAYLRSVVDHPALTEMETLSRASSADVFGAAHELPLADDLTVFSLPIPRYSGIRNAAYTLVGRAAVEFLDGNEAKAETTLLTILSAGLVLAENSPTLIGSLVGFVLVSNGADGLEGLYSVSGREAEASSLRRLREATKRASEIAQQASTRGEMQSVLKGMPKTVLAEGAVRGLRWEYLQILTGVSPCINPSQMLFGPGQEMNEFLKSAREGLVQHSSEEALFDLMNKGWVDLPSRGSWGGRLAAATETILGGRPGQCAAILTSSVF